MKRNTAFRPNEENVAWGLSTFRHNRKRKFVEVFMCIFIGENPEQMCNEAIKKLMKFGMCSFKSYSIQPHQLLTWDVPVNPNIKDLSHDEWRDIYYRKRIYRKRKDK